MFSQSAYSPPQFEDMPSTDSTIDSNITEEEVYTGLLSFDSTKATSIDGISPAVLENCAIV